MTPKMWMFKLMWTAFYMPVHDKDMEGRDDIRVDCDAMSAMNTWIRLP